jgi:hypothetical protein
MADREWMYSGGSHGHAPSNEWIENTNMFLDRAFSMFSLVENDTIKCPCAKCQNYVRHKRFDVEMHLCKHGFRDDYRIWTSHGEGHIEARSDESLDEADRMDDMLVIYNLLIVLLIMQAMYAHHKRPMSNTGSNDGANSGSNPQGVQSNTNQSRRVRDDGGNFERSSPNGVHSSRNNATRVRADCGSSERNSLDGVQSNRNQSRRIAADGGNFRRSSPASVQSNRNKSRSLETDDGNSERSGANGGNPQLNGGDGPSGGNSERIIANASDSQQNGSGDGAQGTEGVNSQLNVGSKQGCENPSKRGRGKLNRTELKMVPRSGRVQLEPSGDW